MLACRENPRRGLWPKILDADVDFQAMSATAEKIHVTCHVTYVMM